MSCNFVVVLVFELCWSFWWAFTRPVFLSFRFSFFFSSLSMLMRLSFLGFLSLAVYESFSLHSPLVAFIVHDHLTVDLISPHD